MHPLYSLLVPFVRLFFACCSNQKKVLTVYIQQLSAQGERSYPKNGYVFKLTVCRTAVILIRTHAFTGRNKIVLAILCGCYLILLSAEVWLFGTRFIGPFILSTIYLVMIGLSLLFSKSGRYFVQVAGG